MTWNALFQCHQRWGGILLLLTLCTTLVAAEPLPRARDYSRIDAAVPSVPKTTLDETAAALAALGSDDWEKARALYDWLCANVDYNVKEFYHPGSLKLAIAASKPEAVFQSGLAVCAGYASLFQTMGEKMGLEVVTISGRAKGTGYNPGDEISVNHDWNAVKLDGAWRLMDATWGAGYVNSEAEGFQREFSPLWFDPPPSLAIHWHLPEEPRWALLAKVPTYAQYKKSTPPERGSYDALAALGIDLHAVANVPIQQLPEGWMIEELTKVQFPVETILALGKRRLTEDQTWDLVSAAERGFLPADLAALADLTPPTVYGLDEWQYRVLQAPASKTLVAGVPVTFRIQAGGFAEGGVSVAGKLKATPVKDGVLTVTVTPTAGPLQVMLKGTYQGEDGFWGILGYQVVAGKKR